MTIKLIAPPHTPFDEGGKLKLETVDLQARQFGESGVSGVFICGSTGEGASLTVEERIAMADRWMEQASQHGLDVIVHVGSNCQPDSIRLAQHAAERGAQSISAFAPSYFKPANVTDLIDYFAPFAQAADPLPFYYYDIPGMTGVSLNTVEFLSQAERKIPTLAGVKYTHSDLVKFQECIRFQGGKYEVWFGCDEALLAGYSLGARGAVGSTYNFAPSLYHQMVSAFDEGDQETARRLQAKSVELVRICESFGFLAAAKAVMSFLNIDCGPVRAPLRNLTAEQLRELEQQVSALGVLEAMNPGDQENNQ